MHPDDNIKVMFVVHSSSTQVANTQGYTPNKYPMLSMSC